MTYERDTEFQSTLRRTERHQPFQPSVQQSDDFNPRSGERSDYSPKASRDKFKISIHAPANGATITVLSCFSSTIISIHAPANGATKSDIIWLDSKVISIHAPANGATNILQLCVILKRFQSTLRRTERPSILHIALDHCYFNPRSGERSDVVLDKHNVL